MQLQTILEEQSPAFAVDDYRKKVTRLGDPVLQQKGKIQCMTALYLCVAILHEFSL